MTTTVPSDAELLGAHVAGDPHAFGELVARHRDRLWAVALRTTGDPEEASDALQDAMISAFRRADQFRGDSAVTTWLHRIVVNASLDRLRRKAVRHSLLLPDDNEDLPGAVGPWLSFLMQARNRRPKLLRGRWPGHGLKCRKGAPAITT